MSSFLLARKSWAAAIKPIHVAMPPLHLNIEPTTHCNYSCKMCNRELVQPMNMPFDMYTKVLDEVQPQKVSLNGFGETFLHPEIFAMIEYAAQKGANIVTSTNGSFIERDMEQLSSCALSVLRVSLDSATAKTYLAIRGKETFDAITSAIKKLAERIKEKESTTSLRLEFVIQKRNQHEITDFVRLTAQLGVKYANFQIYSEPDKKRKANIVSGFDYDSLGSELKKAHSVARELGVNTNVKEFISKINAIRRIYTNEARPQKGVCIHPWVTVYIAVNGDVWGCCRFVTRTNIIGNVLKSSFEDIWNGKKMHLLRRNLKRKEKLNIVCKECQFTTLSDMVWTRIRLLPGF